MLNIAATFDSTLSVETQREEQQRRTERGGKQAVKGERVKKKQAQVREGREEIHVLQERPKARSLEGELLGGTGKR